MLVKKLGWITLLVVCLAGVAVAWVSAAQGTTLARHAIAGGGARLTQGKYSVDNTLGQALVGDIDQGAATLCTGFLCRSAGFRIYVPLVIRLP